MRILVARSSGFCWGVRRAMDMALEATARYSHRGPVRTVGPLIHNPQAMERLGLLGVSSLENGYAGEEGTLVLRAHGIPRPEYLHLARQKSLKRIRLLNGTCPEVARVQAHIRRHADKDYFTIILGDSTHPEVVAHTSFAEAGYAVVSTLEQAAALTDAQLDRATLVAQTTFQRRDFEEISDYLHARNPKIHVKNTICRDTWKRQEEAERLMERVEKVIVVGGKNSNNTRHLAGIAHRLGKPCQHIETAQELDLSGLEKHDRIGVVAGASTPHWIVREVVETLNRLNETASPWWVWIRTARLAQLPFSITLGLLTVLLHERLGWPGGWWSAGRTAFILAGSFLVYPYVDPLGINAKGSLRGTLLARKRPILLGVGTGSIVMGLAAAGIQGLRPLLGSAFLLLLGVLYLRSMTCRRSIWNLRRLPGAKDIGLSLFGASLSVGLSILEAARGSLILGVSAFTACFFFALLFHIHRHIQDFRNDHILGREILPAALGVSKARWIAGIGAVLGLSILVWLCIR